MTYKKHVDQDTFDWAVKIGFKVSTFDEIKGNLKTGIFLAVINIVTVLVGIYAIKYVNIPIFLTMKRCAILATLIC